MSETSAKQTPDPWCLLEEMSHILGCSGDDAMGYLMRFAGKGTDLLNAESVAGWSGRQGSLMLAMQVCGLLVASKGYLCLTVGDGWQNQEVR